jgi:hypothetical protein
MSPQELPKIGLFYMASPFSHYKAGIWPAYKEAARLAGKLAAAGVQCFSPIAHSFPLAIYGEIDPLNHKFWMEIDKPFVAMCKGLIVAKMPGWEESKGIAVEIAEFADRPTFYLDPVTLELTGEGVVT